MPQLHTERPRPRPRPRKAPAGVLLALLLPVLSAWGGSPEAPGPAREPAARALLEAMDAAAVSERALTGTVENMVRADPGLADYRAVLEKLLRRYAGWQRIEPDVVRLYAETFTVAEMQAIADFYRSPAGQKLLQHQVALTVRVSELVRDRMLEHMTEIELALKLRQRQLEQTPPEQP